MLVARDVDVKRGYRSTVGWVFLVALWLVGCGGGAYAKHSADASHATATSGEPGYAPAAGGSYEAEIQADADYGGEAVPTSAPMRALEGGPVPPPAPAPPPAEHRVAQRQPPKQEPAKPAAGAEAPQLDSTESRADTAAIAAPLLIYTATIHLAVFETDATLARAERMARESGGYLVRRDDKSIVFRVPSRKFQAVMESVGELGDVLHREVTAEDVTEQFYDLQIRLKNLRAVRDRFEKLLEQSKTVEEALKVQRELERVTGEIERMEGRMKYLRELIAFATITIELSPRRTENVSPKVNLPFPWLNQLGLGNLLSL